MLITMDGEIKDTETRTWHTTITARGQEGKRARGQEGKRAKAGTEAKTSPAVPASVLCRAQFLKARLG